jgi:hypothetical protein
MNRWEYFHLLIQNPSFQYHFGDIKNLEWDGFFFDGICFCGEPRKGRNLEA